MVPPATPTSSRPSTAQVTTPPAERVANGLRAASLSPGRGPPAGQPRRASRGHRPWLSAPAPAPPRRTPAPPRPQAPSASLQIELVSSGRAASTRVNQASELRPGPMRFPRANSPATADSRRSTGSGKFGGKPQRPVGVSSATCPGTQPCVPLPEGPPFSPNVDARISPSDMLIKG
jgi:hypothetical protein